MNTVKKKMRRRVLPTGKDQYGSLLIRVEGFVASGMKWNRVIAAKLLANYEAGGYVESTYVPEADWKAMVDGGAVEIWARERE